jgi:nitric oxide reductase NorQ protein
MSIPTDPSAGAAASIPWYQPVADEVALFEAAWAARLPVLLKGPTGCGKTRFVEHMAARVRRGGDPGPLANSPDGVHGADAVHDPGTGGSGVPLVTVSCHEDLTANDLVGRHLLMHDRTTWNDGPLTRAVREGAICYLDEIVEARRDTTVVIHSLADHRRVLPIEKTGELLQAHPDFLLVISYNPGYQTALKDLKPSTRQRFVCLEFTYPAAELEARIVAHESGVDPDTAQRLATIAQRLRALHEHGLSDGVSTRALIHAGLLDRPRHRASARLCGRSGRGARRRSRTDAGRAGRDRRHAAVASPVRSRCWPAPWGRPGCRSGWARRPADGAATSARPTAWRSPSRRRTARHACRCFDGCWTWNPRAAGRSTTPIDDPGRTAASGAASSPVPSGGRSSGGRRDRPALSGAAADRALDPAPALPGSLQSAFRSMVDAMPAPTDAGALDDRAGGAPTTAGRSPAARAPADAAGRQRLAAARCARHAAGTRTASRRRPTRCPIHDPAANRVHGQTPPPFPAGLGPIPDTAAASNARGASGITDGSDVNPDPRPDDPIAQGAAADKAASRRAGPGHRLHAGS